MGKLKMAQGSIRQQDYSDLIMLIHQNDTSISAQESTAGILGQKGKINEPIFAPQTDATQEDIEDETEEAQKEQELEKILHKPIENYNILED
ncbi:MAG: hypothetical protein EZS28_011479 [Streblomastix strix]|uniref:Uncharacterized protein n=1 Tax=Streblomastix strix TaxID=222440 RepID=A0A5J4WEK0_9EUKA|nr:MAG: hypothetical protein EZS28_011479 [Streblomastix strix]